MSTASLATLREHEVRIPCSNATLCGDLALPAGARGLVIFAHGSGSSRFSPRNRVVAEVLHGHHLATLLFDLLTPTEAESEAASGELRFNIPFLADRLEQVTRWVRLQDPLGSLGIGYFGASTGAAAALVAASRDPDVQAVVSRGGRSDLAGEAVARVNAPTLLIAGALDEPVIRWNEESARLLPGIKHLVLVPGAGHLFSEPGSLEHAAGLAAEWFELYLSNPAAPQA